MVREASLKQIMVQQKEAGMYALYCEEKKYEKRIAELLEEEFEDVRVCSRWEEFIETSRTATCSILEAEVLSSRTVRKALIQFQVQPKLGPLVLATILTRSNVEVIASLTTTELLWLNQLEGDLVQRIQRVRHKHADSGAVFFSDTRLKHVREYVESNLQMRITLDDVADLACLESKYFSAFFKRKVGISFRKWLQSIRVLEAKHLLTETDAPITQVAYRVGYRSRRGFERAFKNATGATPTHYRKESRSSSER